jgi:hypothetical protein
VLRLCSTRFEVLPFNDLRRMAVHKPPSLRTILSRTEPPFNCESTGPGAIRALALAASASRPRRSLGRLVKLHASLSPFDQIIDHRIGSVHRTALREDSQSIMESGGACRCQCHWT